MPLQINWSHDPQTGMMTPRITDSDHEQRTATEVKEVFEHVLSTGTDYPTKMKRGVTTFWRTEVRQMNKTEFALNAAAGLGIALVVGATITPVGWAFLATAGLTAIAGYTAGKLQESLNYRRGRRSVLSKIDNMIIPSGFPANPERYRLRSSYTSALRLGNWDVSKPMLSALWKHFKDTPYFQHKYLGGSKNKSDNNLEEIATLFAEGEFKSNKNLGDRAALNRTPFRRFKHFDWALKMKKLSYHAAWLHEFSRAWVDIINNLYGEYDHLTEELLKSVQSQFHITGNHTNCNNCACSSELNQISRLSPPNSNITLSRRMQRDLGLQSGRVGQSQLNTPNLQVNLQRELHENILNQNSSRLGKRSFGQQAGNTAMNLGDKGVAFVKTWSISDACAETQAGNVITASLGEFAKSGLGSVVAGGSGGVAGAGIGKLFGWIGRRYTVKIPAKGQMAEVFNIWASGEAFDPTVLIKKECFSEDYLEYVISKLEHYQKKYDHIVENYKKDLVKLSTAEDGRFPFQSCDHARDILSKHAALFLQLSKFHMHVEYLNIFNHAMQSAAEDLVFHVEKTLREKNSDSRPLVRPWLTCWTSIDVWIRYYNSVYGQK